MQTIVHKTDSIREGSQPDGSHAGEGGRERLPHIQ